jgi:uncharacterized membrane protein
MFSTTVSSGVLVLVVAVFLASSVEMVEALTIVFAVGHTRGWRSCLEGVATAFVALTILVALFGPALVRVPLQALHLIVGAILLIFGMQWLRKAILRASGLKAKHDEDAIYQHTVDELAASPASSRDRVAFVVAFKGVFLEGLEVVITVITLGTSAHRLGLASLAAAVAVLCVGVVGVIVSRQLSKVPENAMKMSVGILLSSYGTFWTGEGLKVHWPGNDVMLVGFVGIYFLASVLLVAMCRRSAPRALSVPS